MQIAERRSGIAILPPEVVERIAAGEVIERPAAVVKELVENALDAGARHIDVELRAAGLQLIRVSDDGCGISPHEVELAFARHATSKLRSAGDLLEVRSLGFRGEALPSIAAMATVTLITATTGDAIGAKVTVRDGQLVERSPAARAPGTTVIVRELFQRVPARRMFLRAPQVETAQAELVVRRYALARPDVAFRLIIDGRDTLHTTGSGRLEDAIAAVYGPLVAARLLCIEPVSAGPQRLWGAIGDASVTRRSRQHITLVINGRVATCAALLAALEDACRPLLPRGRYPLAVLFLDVPPGAVDVNIHPAKQEVRLLWEQDAVELVRRAVQETLGRRPVEPPPDLDFSLGALETAPTELHEQPPAYAPEEGDWVIPAGSLPELRLRGQVQQTLIVAESAAGIYLIDQHRAHERVIYEQLRQRYGGATPAPVHDVRVLPDPVLIELRPAQAHTLLPRLDELEALGFRCERFGAHQFLVRSAPAVPGVEGLATVLGGAIEEAGTEEGGWLDRLLVSLSCRAAIRRGEPLTMPQMHELVGALTRTLLPAVCPHGSPLMLHLSAPFLGRQFRWG